jgi:hypothetical protein
VELPEIKQRLHQLLGRDVDVQQVRGGKFACEYLDAQILASPKTLVGDTELDACQRLLTYLEAHPKPRESGENIVEDVTDPA